MFQKAVRDLVGLLGRKLVPTQHMARHSGPTIALGAGHEIPIGKPVTETGMVRSTHATLEQQHSLPFTRSQIPATKDTRYIMIHDIKSSHLIKKDNTIFFQTF